MAQKTKISDEYDVSTKRIAHSELYKCTMCDKIFSSVEDRNWHTFNDPHETTTLKCRYCDLLVHMITKDEYTQHLETHKTYICEQCDLKFLSQYSLLRHCRTTHTKQLQCPNCFKMFWSQRAMDNHDHKSTTQLFHRRKCPKLLTSEHRRDRHENIIHHHNNVKKIKAIMCDPILPDGRINMSANLGPNILPNGCSSADAAGLCLLSQNNVPARRGDTTFDTKTGKIQHIKSVHYKIKYECDICNAAPIRQSSVIYSTAWYLRMHIKSKHTKFHNRCNVCNKLFAMPRTLQQHLDRYPDHKPIDQNSSCV
jgi:DNA-directed RNA polymerase subunit RPC12/RpoP